ncbi:hypothetical protein NIES46_03370 [Arthrospira platensis NIES-46]|uniref:Chromophore lyase CpcT/CpeT n=1 Tax=Limnospira platensis NIES-46 TaxID=1236695 RepID=A0A5M3T2T0_LIMPL|nr:hypothetical protein [Arthrospira platensis]GCE92298.1 hypothetical protein NIES46_03370 [Arthrospira platensis NIES-46]
MPAFNTNPNMNRDYLQPSLLWLSKTLQESRNCDILTSMKLNRLIPVSVWVWGSLFLTLETIAISSPPPSNIPGSCHDISCDQLFHTLSETWPEFNLTCEGDRILSLQVYEHRNRGRRVVLACWNREVDDYGAREGSSLITLPFPGEENRFLSSWPDSQPSAEELLNTYPEEIKNIRFQCAIESGDINILVSEDRPEADLQCYFQAGVILVDIDGDYVSDGENSRGTGVDRILGTFPLP